MLFFSKELFFLSDDSELKRLAEDKYLRQKSMVLDHLPKRAFEIFNTKTLRLKQPSYLISHIDKRIELVFYDNDIIVFFNACVENLIGNPITHNIWSFNSESIIYFEELSKCEDGFFQLELLMEKNTISIKFCDANYYSFHIRQWLFQRFCD